MISLVLQHLENLQLDLTAIDPAHRFDIVDKVAAMASQLRLSASDRLLSEAAFQDGHNSRLKQPAARNH